MPDRVILSTREIEAALSDKAAAAGIVLQHIRFIKIEIIDDSMTTQAITQASTEKLTAIFTSEQAVRAVARHVSNPPDWRAATISGHTEAVLKSFWPGMPLTHSGKNSQELASAILTGYPVGRLQFFCGNQRLNTLPEMLKKGGLDVEELIVYRTISTPQRIEQRYDGIVFFSPSAVDAYFSSNIPDHTITLFSIGHTTAKQIRKYTTQEVYCSSEPSQSAITQLLIDYYATK